MTYIRSFNRFILISLALLGLSVSSANASTIIGGVLLDPAGANQLETWLGVSNQTFTNIFHGTTGASSASWHSSVDTIGDTISIYDITYRGARMLIGGYRHTANTSFGSWGADSAAFIFNLTTSVSQTNVNSIYAQAQCGGTGCDVYDNPGYFATFGGGHDLFGGTNALGLGLGHTFGGRSYGGGGLTVPGPANITGASASYETFTVRALETYTFAPSAVPVPAAVWLFGSALIGLLGFSKRRSRIAA